MKLNDEQLHWLRHMLGINDGSQKEAVPFRNHAAVGDGDLVFFAEMEALGVVEKMPVTIPTDYVMYRVTEVGRRLAIDSFRKIRFSAGRRRYRAYLRVADHCGSFKEFLTSPVFAEIRRGA